MIQYVWIFTIQWLLLQKPFGTWFSPLEWFWCLALIATNLGYYYTGGKLKTLLAEKPCLVLWLVLANGALVLHHFLLALPGIASTVIDGIYHGFTLQNLVVQGLIPVITADFVRFFFVWLLYSNVKRLSQETAGAIGNADTCVAPVGQSSPS
jgi:hypothetical protein